MHRPHDSSTASNHARLGLLASALCLFTAVACAEPIDVHVEKTGDLIIVDVKATVAAKPSIVWGVLTDYDHMVDFISALKTSRVISRDGNVLQVAQAGDAQIGMFHFSFDTVRSVTLVPQREVQSHLIRGDFKRSDFTTKVTSEGANTIITNHGEYIPDRWVPPWIGPSAIRQQTEKQYAELIAEMMKRQSMGNAQ